VRRVALVALVAMSAGCGPVVAAGMLANEDPQQRCRPTAYEESRANRVEGRTYKVEFAGNECTSLVYVRAYAVKRAAETAHASASDHFAVLEDRTEQRGASGTTSHYRTLTITLLAPGEAPPAEHPVLSTAEVLASPMKF
jgi:hypothetical protein